MKKMLSLLFSIPLFVNAQDDGIRFEGNLSWQEIKAKAKAENKFIFVDCYATWCGPCKWMDKNVYPKDTVGRYVNAQFISLKVQMDTSISDDVFITNWYPTAHAFQELYKVNAYPSYLFFSPDGEIVHKGVGAKRVNDFMSLTADAVNPQYQYYTLMSRYLQGDLDYAKMLQLANEADNIGNTKGAEQVADDYLHNYLDQLNEERPLARKDLLFIYRFIKRLRSSDKIFAMCYRKPDLVDSIREITKFGRYCVDNVITREEITLMVNMAKKNGSAPDWQAITHIIKKKYGKDYAEYSVINAKVDWYKYKKEWGDYVCSLIQQVEDTKNEKLQPGVGNMIYWNNNAFAIFTYSNKKSDLEKALSWVDLSSSLNDDPSGEIMDTKANILYKLGRKEEGIRLEERTVAKAPKRKDIRDNYEKMQKDLPTWPVNP